MNPNSLSLTIRLVLQRYNFLMIVCSLFLLYLCKIKEKEYEK